MRYLLLTGLLLGAGYRGLAQPASLVPAGAGRPATWVAAVPLRRGQPAPAFRLQAASGEPVSLQDLRGKVVYLDFWGTFCRPCLAEAPAAAVLKKQFLGREVVFVYIANDTYVEGWRAAITKYAMASPNSLHLLDPDGLRAIRPYHVDGYPTYMLLDRAGRVLDANAPRPSEGRRTVRAIEAALAAR